MSTRDSEYNERTKYAACESLKNALYPKMISTSVGPFGAALLMQERQRHAADKTRYGFQDVKTLDNAKVHADTVTQQRSALAFSGFALAPHKWKSNKSLGRPDNTPRTQLELPQPFWFAG